MTFLDAAAQSKTFRRAWGDLVDGFGKRLRNLLEGARLVAKHIE